MSKSYLKHFLEKHRKEITEHQFPEVSGDEISVDFNSANQHPLTPEECFKADESSLEVPESSALSAEDLLRQLDGLPHQIKVAILIDPDQVYSFKQVSLKGVVAKYSIVGRELTATQEAIVINKILGDIDLQAHEMCVEGDLGNQHNKQ
jgi:hypothetical protein